MKPCVALIMLAVLLAACGTRPPQPPECEGPLTPINTPARTPRSGAVNAP